MHLSYFCNCTGLLQSLVARLWISLISLIRIEIGDEISAPVYNSNRATVGVSPAIWCCHLTDNTVRHCSFSFGKYRNIYFHQHYGWREIERYLNADWKRQYFSTALKVRFVVFPPQKSSWCYAVVRTFSVDYVSGKMMWHLNSRSVTVSVSTTSQPPTHSEPTFWWWPKSTWPWLLISHTTAQSFRPIVRRKRYF